MKIILALSVLAIMFFSCRNRPKLLTVERNGLTTTGLVINDSLFNDTVYTFDTKKRLVKKELFSFGKPNGLSVDYFTNGHLRTMSNYSNGLKHGSNYYFDTLGNVIYSDNYFYGLSVGPVVYYNNKGDESKCFFISLDNKTLLYVDYREWEGVSEIVPKLINYTYEHQKTDTVENMSLFLYLIKIPKLSLEYSIYKKSNSNSTDEIVFTKLTSDNPFIDLSLPVLNDSFYYSVQLKVYDSILNKSSIINKEIW
jgi:hypothetical protein